MFRTKGRTENLTEQVQDQAESLASTAAMLADQLRERVGPAVGQATENAMEWAKPRVERGIEVAAPRLESAVTGLAPKVDTARDMIVDELIPRIADAISAWAAASTAAKDEAVSRGHGAAAVISGKSVASRKGGKGRVLLILGLLGGVAAAAMAVLRRSAPKDDPWTTPLADSYGATPNGRHFASSAADTASTKATTAPEVTIADSPDHAGVPSPKNPASAKTVADDDLNGNNHPVSNEATPDLPEKARAHKNDTSKNETSKNDAGKDGTDENPLT